MFAFGFIATLVASVFLIDAGRRRWQESAWRRRRNHDDEMPADAG
jgi:hypothetical protein